MPIFHKAAFKQFEDGEIHITRIHDKHVLILMLGGMLEFLEDGKKVTLTAGDWYIQRAGLLQEGAAPCGGARYYFVHFSGDIPCALTGNGDHTRLVPQLERLEFLSLTHGDRFIATTLFYNILSELYPDERAGDSTVTRILRTVTCDMSRRYTLSDLADICGYSKNHIISVFKRETGRSPLAYIAQIRHDRAKSRLTESTLPISVIAEQTGYTDYVNFYKDFVKREGITPTQYRKKGCKKG